MGVLLYASDMHCGPACAGVLVSGGGWFVAGLSFVFDDVDFVASSGDGDVFHVVFLCHVFW